MATYTHPVISYDQQAKNITDRWFYHYRQYDRPIDSSKSNTPVLPASYWGMRSVNHNHPEVSNGWLGEKRWREWASDKSQKTYQDRSVNIFLSANSHVATDQDVITAQKPNRHYGQDSLNQSLWEHCVAEDRHHIDCLRRVLDDQVSGGMAVDVDTKTGLLISALENSRHESAEVIINNMNDDVEYEYAVDGKGRRKRIATIYICWNTDAFGNRTQYKYRVAG